MHVAESCSQILVAICYNFRVSLLAHYTPYGCRGGGGESSTLTTPPNKHLRRGSRLKNSSKFHLVTGTQTRLDFATNDVISAGRSLLDERLKIHGVLCRHHCDCAVWSGRQPLLGVSVSTVSYLCFSQPASKESATYQNAIHRTHLHDATDVARLLVAKYICRGGGTLYTCTAWPSLADACRNQASKYATERRVGIAWRPGRPTDAKELTRPIQHSPDPNRSHENPRPRLQPSLSRGPDFRRVST